jgi:hypothetical protein
MPEQNILEDKNCILFGKLQDVSMKDLYILHHSTSDKTKGQVVSERI